MVASPLTISDSDITGVVKTVYSGYREKVFPLSTPLLANVEKGTPGGPRNLRWGGAGVNFDVVLSRPVGMTASSTGYFPPTAAAVEKQGTLDIKRMYVTRQIDGLAITGTQSKEAAYIALARKILEEAKDATQLGMQEVLHGDGRAIKALVGTVNSTTEIIVTSPYGISGAGQGGLLLDVGMYVAVTANDGTTLRGKATISAVSNSGDNATLTLDAAVAGMGAGDFVMPATTSDTSYNSYPNGLAKITNRGNGYTSLHSLDAATYARWDAVRMVAGTDTPSTTPTEMDVWELATRVAGRSGKDAKMKPREFLLLTTPGVEKALAESFLGQRRFDASVSEKIKGGFKALEICGIPLVSDVWCPVGTLYLVHLPSLVWIDSKDWGQVQYESAGAWRWISGRDAFETNWGTYMNFGSLVRNAHGSITGYTDSNRYSFVM